MTNRRKQILIALVALAALALGGSALAGAASGGREPGERAESLRGAAKARAERAALTATGGGRVNQSELDDEDGATYEVEVARSDGSQVDVRLDDDFGLVVVEGDGETQDD